MRCFERTVKGFADVAVIQDAPGESRCHEYGDAAADAGLATCTDTIRAGPLNW